MTVDTFYRSFLGDFCRIAGDMFPRMRHKVLLALTDSNATEHDFAELLGQCQLLLGGQAEVQPEGESSQEDAASGPQEEPRANQGKHVNARMLEMMSKNQECYGWTCGQWAAALKCSRPSVVSTHAWEVLEQHRLSAKAERARDRHGRSTGRRRGDYR